MVPQMLTFAHKGGRAGTVYDHSIMIMHWVGGGRSHNDHSITLLFFGLELQKGPTCIYCVFFGQQYVPSL